MNKIIRSFLIVLLAFAIVGGSVYPNKDFSFVVGYAKQYISPVIESFRYFNGILGSIFGVNSIYNQFEINGNDIVSKLSVYIPYHITKYELHDRCSNQGFSVFTNKYSPHQEHKICKLECVGVYMNERTTGESLIVNLVIFYCGVCNKIIAVFYNFLGDVEADTADPVMVKLYPDNSTISLLNFSFKVLVTANTFKWSEVEEYFN